ncbi:hypothetical protein ACFFUB_09305 [Algimonas porphyrae]|uniref:Uncharacterized protein n=1 Tax=Algimonas porphyrae TaxID=1128113 RepID=A0ABQ5V4N9_9PROT|nr:hypothetical protein [Algimonas porphyrae]GLQ21689.1 hypothetical protein GCM10007854_26440 [Algimonas porphyrae]
MILRRIKAHVENENWFAVAIDFFIVVVGVFIGLQVANWNEARSEVERERIMLVELKGELEAAIHITKGRIDSFRQVSEAGRRSLVFLQSNRDCGDQCWPVLIDFFHASQWQTTAVPRDIFQEMRREGLPTSREIVDAIAAYHLRNDILIISGNVLPEYRSLVRQRIPVDIQEVYWEDCYEVQSGRETLSLDCPEQFPPELSKRTVDTIRSDGRMALTLTEWIGFIVSYPQDLRQEIDLAEAAIAEIDLTLERMR